MKNKHLFLLAIILVCSYTAFAQDTSLFEKKELIVKGDTLPYRMLYPENFDTEKTYPLILFLHGAGERGNDNQKQLTHGSVLFLDQNNRTKFPAIVIMPQCPKDDYWAQVNVDRSNYPVQLDFQFKKGPTKAMDLVLQLLENYEKEDFVDKNKTYVMGLSMGGMGTYELLARQPDRFAAAIAICGAGDPAYATNYAKKIPVWAFHGAHDNVVAPLQTVEMVSALLHEGAFPRLTLYDFANHNSWDPAFTEPDLLPWLFSNSLNKE
ncbi:Alpha/beta hydrolase family protein [Maribacter dokdonensis]|uniref:carboxylesterase family protein n=1 Tax=Maribacter dokdonensis TaxID=320912 RepID=UPI001B26DF31|nr:prolyl oligopeptidase family serine peptidase [Maribacter dokdonensis]CAG2532097.1 Alpha/beta hydrolase family protein [Maribacter dokdonensis]